MGEGASDSQLDVLLYSAPLQLEESLDRIMCSQENPLISSHHDLILSAFKSSKVPFITPPQALSTPKVQNTRIKVCWKSGEGLKQYKSLLASSLPLLHESLSSPPSQALVSVLLKCTNFALNRAAEVLFKTVKLSINSDNKEVVIDRNVKKAQKEALQASKNLRTLALPPPPRLLQSKSVQIKNASSSALRAAVRTNSSHIARNRDLLLHSVLSTDPSKLQAAIRKTKSVGTPSVNVLQVGNNVYTGKCVPDGFYESALNLKVPDTASCDIDPNFISASETYLNILKLAKSGPPSLPFP